MLELSGDYISLVLDSLTYPENVRTKCGHLPNPLDVATPLYVVGGVTIKVLV